MKRVFKPIPKPCSKCCVIVARKLEFKDGFRLVNKLFVVCRLFWNPTDKFVPGENPSLYEKLPIVVLVLKLGVPLNGLACGVMACSEVSVPFREGSNCGTAAPAPSVETTMPPDPAPAPPAPVVVPPAPEPDAPEVPVGFCPPGVPWTKPVFTPRSACPALARRTSVSAIGR